MEWMTVHRAKVVPMLICFTSINPRRMTMMALRGMRKIFMTPGCMCVCVRVCVCVYFLCE